MTLDISGLDTFVICTICTAVASCFFVVGGGSRRLDLLGPRAAVARCASWVGICACGSSCVAHLLRKGRFWVFRCIY